MIFRVLHLQWQNLIGEFGLLGTVCYQAQFTAAFSSSLSFFFYLTPNPTQPQPQPQPQA